MKRCEECSVFDTILSAGCFCQEAESIKLELQEMENELKSCEDQTASIKQAISGFEAQIEELSKSAETTKVIYLSLYLSFRYHLTA